MFRTGQTIGQYTLINQLGRGGFGEVWLAEKRTKFVTTRVAVKLPHDEQVDHETIKHEATLWQQASGHPNILPIIDADEYDGQIVIVSEYAPDGSLEQLLKKNGKLEIKQAVEMTIGILNGLEFLHSRNIIHRDLKPANILLQGETPRLADFGISRAMRTTMTSQSQNISGTFAYMSPEALDGKRSIQTDIWSVGVNLYQFLTGKLPYQQKETSALITAIMLGEPEPLPTSIPQNLRNEVYKALSKNPENRFKTAREMKDALRKILLKDEVIVTAKPLNRNPKTSSPLPTPVKSSTQIDSIVTSYSPKKPKQITDKSSTQIDSILTFYSLTKSKPTHLKPLEKIKGYFLLTIQLLATFVILFSLILIPLAFIAYLTNNNPATVKNNPTILALILLFILVLIFSVLLIGLLGNISPFSKSTSIEEHPISSRALVSWLLVLLLPILGLIAYIPFTPPNAESKSNVTPNNLTPNKAVENSINKSTNAKTTPSPAKQQKR